MCHYLENTLLPVVNSIDNHFISNNNIFKNFFKKYLAAGKWNMIRHCVLTLNLSYYIIDLYNNNLQDDIKYLEQAF